MNRVFFLLLLLMSGLLCNAQIKFKQIDKKQSSLKNIVYIGISNVFSIAAPQEVSIKNIKSSQGNIRMNADNTFALYLHEMNEKPVELTYTSVKNGVETTAIYETKYLVRRMPDIFQLKIGDYTKSGTANVSKIQKNHMIGLNAEAYERELPKCVIAFKLMYMSFKGDAVEMNVSTEDKNTLKEYEKHLSSVKSGDRLFFEEIKITTDEGITRNGENISLIVK